MAEQWGHPGGAISGAIGTTPVEQQGKTRKSPSREGLCRATEQWQEAGRAPVGRVFPRGCGALCTGETGRAGQCVERCVKYGTKGLHGDAEMRVVGGPKRDEDSTPQGALQTV